MNLFCSPFRFFVAALCACLSLGALPGWAEQAPPPAATPVLPNVELTNQLLYELVLGEIALQRGELHLAAQSIFNLAQNWRDPRLAKRATEVAVYARMEPLALQATSLWLELEPGSTPARQALVALLVNAGRLGDARPHLEQLIAAEGTDHARSFLLLNSLLSKQTDRVGVFSLVRDLTKPYANVPEAQIALAQAAFNAEQFQAALNAVREAARLRPGWEPAALIEGRTLQRIEPAQEMQFYRDFLDKYPKAKEVRLVYARALVAASQFEAARIQFQRLVADYPTNPDMHLALGLLSLQVEDYAQAESYFKRALELRGGADDTIRMYLGQMHEQLKRFDQAEQWYASVGEGEHFFGAQLRRAEIMAHQNKLGEARDFLRQVPFKSDQQRVQLTLAEAQLLRNAKAFREAYELLEKALQQTPDYPELLYDRAMAAEKLDRLDVVERDLRALIKLQPDYAHAYNALGYTLADRTDRLAEARSLIEKALSLSPDDAFIIDSLGWVQFRFGQHVESEATLRRAYAIKPDPEIAAHLGEVLWAQGRHDEAYSVWDGSLKKNPENEALLNVIHRFKR
ncbi:MAG: tetratricopeptide repeat protein [Burkholderiales bacterium]